MLVPVLIPSVAATCLESNLEYRGQKKSFPESVATQGLSPGPASFGLTFF